MKKRSRLKSNLQSRAFDLLGKGRSVFKVANALNLPIFEVRRYRQIMLQSETLSPDSKKEILDFVEKKLAEDRVQIIEEFFFDLPDLRKREVKEKEVFKRMERLEEIAGPLELIFFFFVGINIPIQMSDNDDLPFLAGIQRMLDKDEKVCFN